jgi:hypothetical protein
MPGEVVEPKDPAQPIATGDPTSLVGDMKGGAKGFDFKQALPDDLPDEFSMLKGKSFEDMFDSYKNLRAKMTEQGNRVTALEAANQELQEAAAKAQKGAGTKPPETEPQIDTSAFYQVRDQYLETGEVSKEFLDAAAKRGVKVDPETVLRFFEWQRFERQNMAKTLAGHAGGKVTVEEVDQTINWLKSGESPFSAAEIAGFDGMYQRGNYAFFDMVVEEFKKATGDKGFQRGGQQFGGERVRGRPVAAADTAGFKSAQDFQAQLLAVRGDPNLSPFEKRVKEKELVERRKKQHGET